MQISELLNALTECEEEEIFIKDEDGNLHDIIIGREEESFDGFETAYPACLTLQMGD